MAILDYCKLEGKFEVGNYFMLKPKGVSPVKIKLIDIKPGQDFTDCTSFFGAKMFDTHSMEETAEGLKLTNKLVVTGPLKWLWIKLVAQNVANTVPDEMEHFSKTCKRYGCLIYPLVLINPKTAPAFCFGKQP
jgi:hypothetical protein